MLPMAGRFITVEVKKFSANCHWGEIAPKLDTLSQVNEAKETQVKLPKSN